MVDLIVKQTKERGLGVFANQHFSKGDLIECCRVIIVPRSEIAISGSTSVMRHYVFDWGNKLAIPTGFGCYYNHSYQPNSIHQKLFDLREIHFYALADIVPGEEITSNYGGFPTYSEPLWFEVKKS